MLCHRLSTSVAPTNSTLEIFCRAPTPLITSGCRPRNEFGITYHEKLYPSFLQTSQSLGVVVTGKIGSGSGLNTCWGYASTWQLSWFLARLYRAAAQSALSALSDSVCSSPCWNTEKRTCEQKQRRFVASNRACSAQYAALVGPARLRDTANMEHKQEQYQMQRCAILPTHTKYQKSSISPPAMA